MDKMSRFKTRNDDSFGYGNDAQMDNFANDDADQLDLNANENIFNGQDIKPAGFKENGEDGNDFRAVNLSPDSKRGAAPQENFDLPEDQR